MVAAVVPSFSYALYARTTSAIQTVFDKRATDGARGTPLRPAARKFESPKNCLAAASVPSRSLACITSAALFGLLADYGRPYVLTWGVDPMRQHPSVGFDNRAATFEMTRYLIDLGHRRFGLLSAVTDGNDRATERGAGMRAALAQAGLTLDERNAQYGPIDLAAAAEMMRRILEAQEPSHCRCLHQRRLRRRRHDGVPVRGRSNSRSALYHGRRQYRSRCHPDAAADEHPYSHRRDRPGGGRAGYRATRRKAPPGISNSPVRTCLSRQHEPSEGVNCCEQPIVC